MPTIPPKPANSIVIGGRVIKPKPVPTSSTSTFAKAYIKFSEVVQKEMEKGLDIEMLMKQVDTEMDTLIVENAKKKKDMDWEVEKMENELKTLKAKLFSSKRKRTEMEKTITELEAHKKMKETITTMMRRRPFEEEQEEDEVEESSEIGDLEEDEEEEE